MNAKITLYSDAKLIDKVKSYAQEHNTSVSKIVTNFFEHLTSKEDNTLQSKKSSKLVGILKHAKIDESEYKQYLEKKYL